MSKKIRIFIKYLSTALVTAIMVMVLCLIVEMALLFKCENYVTKNELNIDNLVKFATLEQLEKRLKNEPANYVVMVRLAKIHEELGNSYSANKYYVNALKISGRSPYVLFNYAMFCADNNLYAVSSALAEEISSTNKHSIEYKMKIYERVADKMLANKEYEGAVKAYQVAYKYSKTVKEKKYKKRIKDNFAYAYIKLADKLVEKEMISEAITALNNSIKLKETPLAQYKLALLYVDSNKIKAQKLIENVFYSEPYIVNPYIYNKLLTELIDEATASNNQNALNYYSVKYSRFKKTMEEVYLYKQDVEISNSVIVKDKDKYILEFDLTNKTKYKIEQLYLDIDLFLNSKRYKLTKKIVHLSDTLSPYGELKGFKIKLPSNIQFVDIADHNYLILKYYAKKSVRAPSTLVKIESLNF